MKRCLWNRRRRNQKDIAINGMKLKRDSDNNGMQDDVWFDSKLMFESDSDDDFKSVNGDSLPSSFGYSYTCQGTPRPSFLSLRERMNEPVQDNVDHDVCVQPSSAHVPAEKKTLGQLFTAKPEQDKLLEREKKDSEVLRQGSKKGHSNGDVSQRSCFSGLLSTIGPEKKSASSPIARKTNSAQSWLPYRLCAS